jgi:hypothetical protein
LLPPDFPIPHPYWIETLDGHAFDLMRPTPHMIRIHEVAHALSLKCRWGGHIPVHYSVAQHSWLVASLVPAAYKRRALLHDVEEAYGPDFLSPYKKLIRTHTEVLSFYARLVREAAGLAFDEQLVTARPETWGAYLAELGTALADAGGGRSHPTDRALARGGSARSVP